MSKDIPAFPIPLSPGESYMGHHVCDGMTLRDYFAAKVIPVVYKRAFMDMAKTGFVENWKYGVALDAYAMADAMLEARK